MRLQLLALLLFVLAVVSGGLAGFCIAHGSSAWFVHLVNAALCVAVLVGLRRIERGEFGTVAP